MKIFKSIILSYSQILFSNRIWFGIVIFISTLTHPKLAFAGIFGAVITNLIAHVVKFDKKTIESGYFGFNGLLFCTAAIFYFDFSILFFFVSITFIIILFGIIFLTENLLHEKLKYHILSVPFLITFFLFLIYTQSLTDLKINQTSYIDNNSFVWLPKIAKLYFNSLGMIYFVPSILTGIIVSFALLFFSRISFLLSIISFSISLLLAQYLLPKYAESYAVVIGLNSILSSIAIGGSLIVSSKKSFILTILIQPILIIIIGILINLFGVDNPISVIPFNILVLFLILFLKLQNKIPDLIPIYFFPGSPEENFFYHNNNINRFKRFKYLFAELPFFGAWKISQGVNGKYTHKNEWNYAFDFVVTDEQEKEFSNGGNSLNEYYCYRLPVIATLDGVVAKVVDSIPNNPVGKLNVEQNFGNTIILNHGSGLYSSVSHLEPHSAKVKVGDYVRKGNILAMCGNSGRSQYPHIHFQFQLSDKIGDKTFEFPISNFIQYDNQKQQICKVKTFTQPDENSYVKNIENNFELKSAFDFGVGNKFIVSGRYKNKILNETWIIKIDSVNTITIENEKGDSIIIYPTQKINYFTHYNGSKHSALYSFYLSAFNIPFSYNEKLKWSDSLPHSNIPTSPIYYFANLFLFFGSVIDVNANFSFENQNDNEEDYLIKNEILVSGNHIFSWYKNKIETRLFISKKGMIKNWTVHFKNKILFTCHITERIVL